MVGPLDGIDVLLAQAPYDQRYGTIDAGLDLGFFVPEVLADELVEGGRLRHALLDDRRRRIVTGAGRTAMATSAVTYRRPQGPW
jgi:hypothetical protein